MAKRVDATTEPGLYDLRLIKESNSLGEVRWSVQRYDILPYSRRPRWDTLFSLDQERLAHSAYRSLLRDRQSREWAIELTVAEG